MTIPPTILTVSDRWEAYAKRRFMKSINGGVNWMRSKLMEWTDAEQFDAQVTRHGDVYTIHITVQYKTPSPSPFWVEAPSEELSPIAVRQMVQANRKTTTGLHLVK